MTWEEKHNENVVLIELYLNYISDAKGLNDKLELVREISRLDRQNELIQRSPVDKYISDCIKFNIE